ncbi:MAG TPA: sensor histidine kinase [Limnobacter sp.]|nr:sensor histidine kinase [Limnobacter sp.]
MQLKPKFEASTFALPMATTLLIVVMVWLARLPVQIDYTDLILERSYLEDRGGVETIETVQSKSFKPFDAPVFLGNDQGPVWLRMVIAPAEQADWALWIQPNYTALAEVWAPGPDGSWTYTQAGTSLAFDQRAVNTLTPAVPLMVSSAEPMVVYARVTTPTTPVYVRVISMANSMKFDSLLMTLGGIFCGMGFFVAVGSLIVYAATRDSLWLWDTIYNFSGITVLGLQLGLFQRFFDPGSAGVFNHLIPLSNVLHAVVSILLFYRIYSLFTNPRFVLWGYLIVPLLAPGLVWLIFNGQADTALTLNNLGTLFITSLGLFNSFLAKHPDRLLLYTFRAAHVVLMAFVVYWILPIALQIPLPNFSSLFPNVTLSYFTMFILLFVLGRNTQLRMQEATRLELQKRQAEVELELTKQRHEESNSFYGMLLHEVKNPLATIRMAVSNLENSLRGVDPASQARLSKVQNAVDDVDELLRRGVEVDMLEQGALIVRKEDLDVVKLVIRTCKAHAMGWRVQVHSGAAIQASADAHLLTLMVGNLIDNALKYSPDKSTVDVSIQSDGKCWTLEVRNMVGHAGLPDEHKIFNKYYRSSLAAYRSGMGLGLYWVHGVAHQMGGSIAYQQSDQEVIFKLCLPL